MQPHAVPIHEPGRFLRGMKQQNCPMCGGDIVAGTPVCRACGADLTRTAFMSTSTITPITHRSARLVLPARAASVIIALSIVVGLGSVSIVSARIPALRTVSATVASTFHQVIAWGKAMRRPRFPAAQQKPAIPQPADVVASKSTNPAAALTPPSLVTIITDPAGAQVVLDTAVAGTTPLTLNNLAPGQHAVSLRRSGYQEVSRTFGLERGESVTLNLTLGRVVLAARKPAQAIAITPTPSPKFSRRPLEVGARAPHFVLKDRIGVIYNLNDLRGQRIAVLFVWNIDARARGLIKDLDVRNRRGEGQYIPVVIALAPNRVAIRNLVTTEQIRIPILLGNDQVAEKYGVSHGIPVMYVISEQGIVMRRQAGTVQFTASLP